MAVRTARLTNAYVGAGSDTVIGTVPAGETWIVKQVDVHGVAFLNSSIQVYWLNPSTGTRGYFLVQTLASPYVAHYSGFAVGEPGDELHAFSSANDIEVWASGSKLEGVAP